MVPKLEEVNFGVSYGFRAVLFRMVPKPKIFEKNLSFCFRAVLFRMVPKLIIVFIV